ncbi:TTF-type domain-containing protein [Trichonephila clavipes]|nr:TTF-type domain-containing protein [Trichonephila clavipes]
MREANHSHTRFQVKMTLTPPGTCFSDETVLPKQGNFYRRYENTKKHVACMFQWITLEKEIKHGDRGNERRILESQKHWTNLFERLRDIINFLAYNKLAFRGHRKSLKTDEEFRKLHRLI